MYLLADRRAFLRSLVLASATSGQAFSQNGAAKEDDPVYEAGGDVKPPKLIHYVEPEFSPSSKEAYVEGTVKLSTVVTVEGRPTQSKVVSGLSTEEDRTAMDALEKWKFQPGSKDGKAVCVHITVQIDFHLL